MTQISEQQWNRLGSEAFESRVIAVIRKNHPELSANIATDRLQDEIRRQVLLARRYALDDEQSVAIFAYAAWLLGPMFDERIPAVAQILNAPGLSSATKAGALSDFCVTVFHSLGVVAQHRQVENP